MTELWEAKSYVYLLRCWPVGSGETECAPEWRFLLEEVAGEQQRYGFTALADLMEFLRATLALAARADDAE